MKTKLFALLILASMAFVSCEEKESDEVCDNPEAMCPSEVPIEASACCTDVECYWTYNDKKYECDGDDCSDALALITADACAAGIAVNLKSANSGDLDRLRAELQAFTSKLLIEARSASGCQ